MSSWRHLNLVTKCFYDTNSKSSLYVTKNRLLLQQFFRSQTILNGRESFVRKLNILDFHFISHFAQKRCFPRKRKTTGKNVLSLKISFFQVRRNLNVTSVISRVFNPSILSSINIFTVERSPISVSYVPSNSLGQHGYVNTRDYTLESGLTLAKYVANPSLSWLLLSLIKYVSFFFFLDSKTRQIINLKYCRIPLTI